MEECMKIDTHLQIVDISNTSKEEISYVSNQLNHQHECKCVIWFCSRVKQKINWHEWNEIEMGLKMISFGCLLSCERSHWKSQIIRTYEETINYSIVVELSSEIVNEKSAYF